MWSATGVGKSRLDMPIKMNNKSQEAMEILLTYGWAILIVMIVGIVLWQLGIFNDIDDSSEKKSDLTCLGMTLDEAQEIVQDCEGGITNGLGYHVCNTDTRTWWLESALEKEGCNPACVVDIESETAEINWRCTGVI